MKTGPRLGRPLASPQLLLVRDTATLPTKRHRVLILLLLFATGCRPAELVDARKRTGNAANSSIDELGLDVDDGFCADSDGDTYEDQDEISSLRDTQDGEDAISGVELYVRRFDALSYEDVRVLVVHNSNSEEPDVLAMEVKLAHQKVHHRRLKL